MEGTGKIRLHLRISGSVQGVGFRYRAQQAAGMLGVTGWVKNNWDDTVEMEAQGSREQIDDLLTMVNRGTYVEIERIDRKNIPLEEHETGFRVRD